MLSGERDTAIQVVVAGCLQYLPWIKQLTKGGFYSAFKVQEYNKCVCCNLAMYAIESCADFMYGVCWKFLEYNKVPHAGTTTM